MIKSKNAMEQLFAWILSEAHRDADNGEMHPVVMKMIKQTCAGKRSTQCQYPSLSAIHISQWLRTAARGPAADQVD